MYNTHFFDTIDNITETKSNIKQICALKYVNIFALLTYDNSVLIIGNPAIIFKCQNKLEQLQKDVVSIYSNGISNLAAVKNDSSIIIF